MPPHYVLLSMAFFLGVSGRGFLQSRRARLAMDPSDTACPALSAMPDFDLNKFLGQWNILEYIYAKPMKMKELSCVGFHFSMVGPNELQSNFTFRFPPNTGHFYHVPTFNFVDSGNAAVWDTNLRGAELASLIVGTNYSRWAILVQCNKVPGNPARFLSTRILSRTRTLSSQDLRVVSKIIQDLDIDAPYRYPIEQGVCQELDSQQ